MADLNGSAASEHRLVIVGGGVAGLDMATHLAGKRAAGRLLAVTLIDRETAYVWKPMLHTIAAGTSDAGSQQTVYAAQARSHGFGFQPGEATSVDRDRREVALAPLRADSERLSPPERSPTTRSCSRSGAARTTSARPESPSIARP